MLLVVALLLSALVTNTVNCYPVPHHSTASIMAARQQLGNILQQAAKNLLNKMESSPSPPQPSLKLRIRPAVQQPQNRYNAPPRQAPTSWKPIPAKPPVVSLPNVHIHPPAKPVQPVPPMQEMPPAGVHIYPSQGQPPSNVGAPHLHIHPSSPRQRVAVVKPRLPLRPSTPPVNAAPVLHVHPPTQSRNGGGGSEGNNGKDKKENDVQLKLNMDFKAHNRTGFQELQRQVEQAQLQSVTVRQGMEQLLTRRVAKKLEELLRKL